MIYSVKRAERGCAWTMASRSASVNSENAMPSTCISAPAVTSAMTGCMNCGMPGAGIRGSTGAQYANEPVTTPEFGTDEIAVRAEHFAQGGDLNLEVLFRDEDTRPPPSEKLLFCDERAVGLQQDQEEGKGASTNLDRKTIGEQLPPAQQ